MECLFKTIKRQYIYSSIENSEVVLVFEHHNAGFKKLSSFVWTDKWLICLHEYHVSFKVSTRLWTEFFILHSWLIVTRLVRVYCTLVLAFHHSIGLWKSYSVVCSLALSAEAPWCMVECTYCNSTGSIADATGSQVNRMQSNVSMFNPQQWNLELVQWNECHYCRHAVFCYHSWRQFKHVWATLRHSPLWNLRACPWDQTSCVSSYRWVPLNWCTSWSYSVS
jgi:hypothetical protein